LKYEVFKKKLYHVLSIIFKSKNLKHYPIQSAIHSKNQKAFMYKRYITKALPLYIYQSFLQ